MVPYTAAGGLSPFFFPGMKRERPVIFLFHFRRSAVTTAAPPGIQVGPNRVEIQGHFKYLGSITQGNGGQDPPLKKVLRCGWDCGWPKDQVPRRFFIGFQGQRGTALGDAA